jgi:hypothetical protein
MPEQPDRPGPGPDYRADSQTGRDKSTGLIDRQTDRQTARPGLDYRADR